MIYSVKYNHLNPALYLSGDNLYYFSVWLILWSTVIWSCNECWLIILLLWALYHVSLSSWLWEVMNYKYKTIYSVKNNKNRHCSAWSISEAKKTQLYRYPFLYLVLNQCDNHALIIFLYCPQYISSCFQPSHIRSEIYFSSTLKFSFLSSMLRYRCMEFTLYFYIMTFNYTPSIWHL